MFFVVYWSKKIFFPFWLLVYCQRGKYFGDSRQCLQSSAKPKRYKYERSCIHVPQFEMQFKAVNKVIASILLFAVVQTLACRSSFITLHQGIKLIVIFRDYHRQERECKLILRLSFSPRLTTRYLGLYLLFS